MKKITSIETLNSVFDAEVEFSLLHKNAALAASDIRPVVVFLISGIRSDRTWAQNFRIYSNSSTARKIYPYVVGGSKDLTSFDLIFRYRLGSFRKDFVEQIEDTLKIHSNADINFLCHSMGSSLFSDIVSNVKSAIKPGSGNEIINIVFIGSLCHKKHSGKIKDLCKNFINDVGLRDPWPFMASVINPIKYSAVGRSGFFKTHVQDRIFKDLNHYTCTAEDHVSEWIVPIFEDGIIREIQESVSSIGSNKLRYIRRVVWLASALFSAIMLKLLF